jgi:hypothetical protein
MRKTRPSGYITLQYWKICSPISVCTVVGPAARVEQALAMIETAASLDAAVLDVNINGQKSYPVADALVAGGVPFVFATGYGPHSLMNGYSWFPLLQKPFKRLELGKALMKLLTEPPMGFRL